MTTWTVFGNQCVTLGYLSTEQLQHAICYIENLKLSQAKSKLKQQNLKIFKNFIQNLFKY